MKFHHMTTSSPNGSPPSTSTRAPSLGAPAQLPPHTPPPPNRPPPEPRPPRPPRPRRDPHPIRMPAGADHGQLTPRDSSVGEHHRAGIDEHRHLEALGHRHHHR